MAASNLAELEVAKCSEASRRKPRGVELILPVIILQRNGFIFAAGCNGSETKLGDV